MRIAVALAVAACSTAEPDKKPEAAPRAEAVGIQQLIYSDEPSEGWAGLGVILIDKDNKQVAVDGEVQVRVLKNPGDAVSLCRFVTKFTESDFKHEVVGGRAHLMLDTPIMRWLECEGRDGPGTKAVEISVLTGGKTFVEQREWRVYPSAELRPEQRGR